MKTALESFAGLIALTVWADGEYDELERQTAEDIAEAFDLNTSDFCSAVEKAVREIVPMNETEANGYLEKTAAEIVEDERGPVFEAVLEMALSDGILTEEETNNILSISDAMGMDRAFAVMLLCDLIKTDPDIEILINE